MHRLAWPPAQLAESPISFRKVVFISQESPLLEGYRTHLSSIGIETQTVAEPEDIVGITKHSIIVFIADGVSTAVDLYPTAAANCRKLLNIVKGLITSGMQNKVFAITQGVFRGLDHLSLSQSPLAGLARIIQSEEPEVFGGLIDVEDAQFPMQAIKYVQGADVIRVEDSVARNARLRPFAKDPTKSKRSSFSLRPNGTYLITGGLGALGLELAEWLAHRGARRLVLVSRRSLPSRHLWASLTQHLEIQRMLALEQMGVSVYSVAVNMTAHDASQQLQSALNALSLPPVLGVVHAAGTLANQMVVETTPEAFNSVISPKIQGAMALHSLFPLERLTSWFFSPRAVNSWVSRVKLPMQAETLS